MQTEKALSQKFIQYLKEHGYPEESIVCEWKIRNYRVDLAIIDIQTKKVMAIYEFKNSNYKNSNIAYNQIVKFLDEIGDYTIPAYIVYDYNNEYGFSVKKIEVNSEKNIGNDIPNYKILQNSFNNGYMYISYEDVLIETDLTIVTGSEKVDYDKIYQNDYYGGLFAVGTTTADTGYYGTKFTREFNEKEHLTDVGITVSDYVDVEIYLNSSGNSTLLSSLIKVGEAKNLEPGYYKIDVTPTKLTGNEFSIVVKQKSKNGIFYFSMETAVDATVFEEVKTSGNSYYSMDGYTWTNINELEIQGMNMKSSDVCIKAFTKEIEEEKPTVPEEPVVPEDKFESSTYKISEKSIMKVKYKTTKEKFLNNITTNLEMSIYTEDGKEVTDENTIIKTGMKLKVSNGKEYVIAVRGDMNCDGLIDIVDLSKLLAHYVQSKGFILQNSPLLAADLNCDGIVDIIDISQMVVLYSKGV